MHTHYPRKSSSAWDEKDCARSLRTDSTDDECGDDHSEPFEDENLNWRGELRKYSEGNDPFKYKTEMCKNYAEKGRCHYNEKCQFAHGWHELTVAPEHLFRVTRKSYRSRRCKNFWSTGQCMYGLRCQFGHYEVNP